MAPWRPTARPMTASRTCTASGRRRTPRCRTETAARCGWRTWRRAGRRAGRAVLHGEPTWSFLYRKLIPVLADGRPADGVPGPGRLRSVGQAGATEDHTYERHVEWVRELAFDVLDLRAVTLVGQDWGGLIGLRLAAEQPDRFARLVPANTGLPTGEHPMPEVWCRFRAAIHSAPSLDIGRFVQSGCRTELSPEVLAAYDAPFPDDSYTAGPRAMPGLVPTQSTIRPAPPTAPPGRPCPGRDPDPGRVQRQRPDHRSDGLDPATRHAWRRLPRSPGNQGCRPLPPGGRRRGRSAGSSLPSWPGDDGAREPSGRDVRPLLVSPVRHAALLAALALVATGCGEDVVAPSESAETAAWTRVADLPLSCAVRAAARLDGGGGPRPRWAHRSAVPTERRLRHPRRHCPGRGGLRPRHRLVAADRRRAHGPRPADRARGGRRRARGR